jgi:hypothetical protein
MPADTLIGRLMKGFHLDPPAGVCPAVTLLIMALGHGDKLYKNAHIASFIKEYHKRDEVSYSPNSPQTGL